jgi:ABC-type nitrate/sulfonate/bicarbonate transport system substrate-binding protein
MQKIHFPYRAATHLNLLHVVSESGSWERHGLDVDYDYQVKKDEAHELVASGQVEFVGGNHVSTYGRRARGDNWVYVGQSVNVVRTKLVVRPDSGINGVADLRGKKIGIRGTHPGLNDWLFLKQHGLDADRDELELVRKVDGLENLEAATQIEGPDKKATSKRAPLWHWVRDGQVDGALLTAPSHLFALEGGLKVIDVDPLPMIWFTTISSNLTFVRNNPDIVKKLLLGMIDGIHFFKTQPEKSIDIIMRRYTKEGQLNRHQAAYIYNTLKDDLEPALYPNLTAIQNVFEEAKRTDKDAAKVNPLELWDLHHIREIDDSGYVRDLYASKPVKRDFDPEQQAQRLHNEQAITEVVKKCGHLAGIDCGCE